MEKENIICKYLSYLFIRHKWSIGYRFNTTGSLPFAQNPKYKIIRPSIRWWYADPFCIRKEDKYYIFCEMLDSLSGKGVIGAFEYSGNKISKAKKVLEEDFHLSYPNVFYYKDNYYMIPETARINQVRLYKAVEFPTKWELDSVLIDGVKAADSTILEINNERFLFTYDISEGNNKLLIFNFDIDKKNLTLIKDCYEKNSLMVRPAGNFIIHNNKIIRPAQDNTRFYGESLIFYEVKETPERGYKEDKILALSANDICTESNKRFSGVHTINSDGNFEVIDLLDSGICIIKPVFIMIRLLKRLIKRFKI